jgi:flagellar hook assembly protein FlgD
VFGEPRLLTRVAAAEASAPSVESPADGGRLSDLVRTYGVTGLSFGVPDNAAGTTVTIRVYTSAARLVRVLVNEPMLAGFYEIGWDGLDDRGRTVAPGVYFAVLTMGGERVTQRLLIRH